MARPRHTDKEVEDAVADAETRGWTWRKQGHWGRIYCPQHDREGCQFGIHGTPRNGGDHARQIRRAVLRCAHEPEQQEQEEADDGEV